MRKFITLTIIFLATMCVTRNLSAQKHRNDRGWEDRMKAEKIAYLTGAMDLTPAEAEKFWPVYNKAEAETRQSWKRTAEAYIALDQGLKAGKDDKEIGVLLDKYLEARKAGEGIEIKYTAEYRKILSNEKIAKLHIAEESFRRQQIHRLNRNENSKTDKK